MSSVHELEQKLHKRLIAFREGSTLRLPGTDKCLLPSVDSCCRKWVLLPSRTSADQF